MVIVYNMKNISNYLILKILPAVGGMTSKGLRAISYQSTRKIEAGYKPSYTTKTLIGHR